MEVRLVRWVDSAAQAGWGDRSLFTDHCVSDNESVGYVFREDDTQVVLVQSVDSAHDNLDAAIAIPKVCITDSLTLHRDGPAVRGTATQPPVVGADPAEHSRLARLAAAAELPEGAMPSEAVLVVGMLDEDGSTSYQVVTGGDGSTSGFVGLLAMASHDLIHHANPTPCEDES